MAEIGKGGTAGKLAINVQKRLTRAQEKVLQKLGKADETRDAAFEEMVANFNKQMAEGTKLQKDLKTYLAAMKTMHDAARRLQSCLADMYEPDWFGKEELDSLAEDTDTLWLDVHQSISDKSLVTMDTYLTQFPDIKARIAKRDRKMVDFDSARHHFASLQKGKKKDEAKIAKAEEELGRAQKIFEELNVELQDELPVLWDSRVGIYVNTFQSLAGQQEKFHREMSKLSQNLNDIMTKLEEQRQLKKGGTAGAKTGDCAKSEEANHSESADSPPKRLGPPPSRPPHRLTPSPDERQHYVDLMEDEASAPDASTDSTSAMQQTPSWDSWHQQTAAEQEPQRDDEQHPEKAQGGWDYAEGSTQSRTKPDWVDAETNPDREKWNDDGVCAAQSHIEPSWDDEDEGAQVHQGHRGDDEAQSAVTNDSDGELPPGFLYKVKAVHDYTATDGDELELKIGDIVLVLGFDNAEEQDDGWLLGLKESHWLQKKDISAKGVFPENFTQKV
ncbi:myc box-dependent-interacting protein 1b isoform X5 [Channa argus]|uniref:myc box-dependent-interacting protein 1b isoform X5 n=1 Tax=Channa argus TaxID=215402 RepID=UPI00352069FB